MKKFKAFVSFILSAAMAFSLFGCTDKKRIGFSLQII